MAQRPLFHPYCEKFVIFRTKFSTLNLNGDEWKYNRYKATLLYFRMWKIIFLNIFIIFSRKTFINRKSHFPAVGPLQNSRWRWQVLSAVLPSAARRTRRPIRFAAGPNGPIISKRIFFLHSLQLFVPHPLRHHRLHRLPVWLAGVVVVVVFAELGSVRTNVVQVKTIFVKIKI